MAVAQLPAADQIWDWLAAVPDPEIPVISVVDLGIVRDVRTEGDEVVVTITPTYSGCPATEVIAGSITQTLREHGLERLRLETRLSPAWTTDWLSERGREQLRQYGIAPPVGTASQEKVIDISALARRRPVDPEVQCPHCGSMHTRVTSQFGSTPCKALYRCQDCLEPFDYFKCH